MLRGRSPNGRLLPAGVSDQPFGRLTLLLSSVFKSCYLALININNAGKRNNKIFNVDYFELGKVTTLVQATNIIFLQQTFLKK